jgi:hypothetical protein
MSSKLKMFVNNPELWDAFTQEIKERIEFDQRQLEQLTDTTVLYKLQGCIATYRSLLKLRDKVNAKDTQ